MWYVNAINIACVFSPGISFYINYVICKSVTLYKELKEQYTFILTMWYVNQQIRDKLQTLTNLLY